MKNKYVLLLLCLICPIIMSALDCSVCNKKIRGKYIKTEKDVFCSRRCYLSTRPTCAECGRKCEKQVFTFMNKMFCSRQCMHSKFSCYTCGQGADNMIGLQTVEGKQVLICPSCHKRERCYYCSMPGDGAKLRDGRHICRICRKTAITNHNEIRRIFRQVRRNMGIWFGYDQKHPIELKIVSIQELSRRSGSIYLPADGKRMALMNHEQQITEKRYITGKKERYVSKERCRIFILESIPQTLLADALAHELTHDYLRHNKGKVTDLTNEEGFCELMASLYNEKMGNRHLNKRKDQQSDPVYGDGYRKMRKIYERSGNNWRRALNTIKADKQNYK